MTDARKPAKRSPRDSSRGPAKSSARSSAKSSAKPAAKSSARSSAQPSDRAPARKTARPVTKPAQRIIPAKKAARPPSRPAAAQPPQKAAAKSARHRAREFALQGVYQWLVAGGDASDIAAQISEARGFEKSDVPLFRLLLSGAIRHAEASTQAITPLLDRPIVELSPVERGVLLMGAYEFTHCPDTPYRVIINEAVELAKSFGGTDGHKYVNGVLDKLAPALRDVEVQASKALRRG